MTSHSQQYLVETATISSLINPQDIEDMVAELVALRDRGGRLFVIGLGGSAANASHAVNDMRRLCAIEAYTPVDNVAEFSAAMNDDGPHTVFSRWLVVSNLSPKDVVFVLSVGGGTHSVSGAITAVVEACANLKIPVLGIVGKERGATQAHATKCIIIPNVKSERITPHSEGWQSVILHCLVSHPYLQTKATKW